MLLTFWSCPCPLFKPFECVSNDLFLLAKDLELGFEMLEFDRIFSDKYLKLAFKLLDELDRSDLILLDKDRLELDEFDNELDDEEFTEDVVKIELLVKEAVSNNS